MADRDEDSLSPGLGLKSEGRYQAWRDSSGQALAQEVLHLPLAWLPNPVNTPLSI